MARWFPNGILSYGMLATLVGIIIIIIIIIMIIIIITTITTIIIIIIIIICERPLCCNSQ